ncbi:MAG: protein-glutamate O-methyltransferase CheR [Polyangiaceae bacterium]|nr:protein-glutamate O-methyltransferase CheR [Polyangiaceae bacterium]
MRASLGLEDFEQIRRLLNKHAGLWFTAEVRPAIERRLRDRLVALGINSFTEYRRRLEEGDLVEIGEAVEVCTVNETYAFRGARQLRTFRDVLLPRLAPTSPHRQGRGLVVWSAGCASGEEAYTLGAIVLASGLFDPSRIRIFGTDISRRCIAAARRGIYSASSFRDDASLPYEHYFIRQVDGTRSVVEELRNICHFRQANLLEPSAFGFIDVVFCRNVLIHMDEASRRKVVQSFYDRLSPGGYLILGHSESLLKEQTDFVPEELPDDLIYRKPNVGEALSDRASFAARDRGSKP